MIYDHENPKKHCLFDKISYVKKKGGQRKILAVTIPWRGKSYDVSENFWPTPKFLTYPASRSHLNSKVSPKIMKWMYLSIIYPHILKFYFFVA